METAPLKSFATWARTALIREVTARVAVVLAPASPERVEQRTAVEALEKAVGAAGGGDKGKAAVADRVAYTWFNRIIALRFMDANGYTGIGVVSSQAGVETGQPEILAEAKRGNIDAAVVGTKTRETVKALLNGTRRSDDAQGEAYALLLADYCRFWNHTMPFMFEREGDFTELLIPANLLADDSVPSRAAKVLTTEVCQDVEVIGWLYQFYISERKDEVFAGFKKNKKAGADEIPAATQLFTPHWIVRYLVENSLGRLWMLNRPGSRLVDQMRYYIAPVDEETDFIKIARPEEFKVVDPACGSGHMLTYAFDLLYAIYEEEGYAPAEIPGLILTNNLYGVEIDPRAGALAAFALTMKARAKQRTFFNKQVEPNVRVLDPICFTPDEIDFLLTRGGDKHAEAAFWNQFKHADTLGSLIQPDRDLVARLKQHIAQLDGGGDILLADVLDRAERMIEQAEYLSSQYSIAIANPPYMGSKNMSADLVEWVRANYPDGKQDLYGAFIIKALRMTRSGGIVAMITGDSWMTISGFEGLRRRVLHNHSISGSLHLIDASKHADTFGSNAAFIIATSRAPHRRCTFVRLEPLSSEAKRSKLIQAIQSPDCEWMFEADTTDFEAVPGYPFAYSLPESLLLAFDHGRPLVDIARPRQGLATADNDRFLRWWFEVSQDRVGYDLPSPAEARASGRKWFPTQKGGDFRRWFGNHQYLVNWERDGDEIRNFKDETGRLRSRPQNLEFFFREGISWTAVTASAFSLRYSPPGFISNAKGPMIFPDSDEWRSHILGFGNCPLAQRLLSVLAPTIDYSQGPVGRLPILGTPEPEHLRCVARLVEIAREDWASEETSWEFGRHDFMPPMGSPILLSQALAESDCRWSELVSQSSMLESQNNLHFASIYGAPDLVGPSVDVSEITLLRNPEFMFRHLQSSVERTDADHAERVRALVSYAVGCMFGRYSLDEPGLILADQGASVLDYLAKVPNPTFAPDNDNVIPVVDGDWFEDDIVARFRTFLRVAFGEQHFEENLRFVTESLGVKDIRDYFVRSFYRDHVQRYKKRPIYWLFSSPKGSFNALIYMHRYTPSTVSTVLNEYLREFTAKLTSSLQQQDRLAAGDGTPRQQAAAQKEADRLRKVLLELEEYEHDVLYPLASRQLAMDLDDGVKANYPKFGAALKKIPGLEASDE